MTRENTCCFSGHRTIPAASVMSLTIALRQAIDDLIALGVTDFIAGGARGFDTLAAREVLRRRDGGAPVRLFLVLPCRDQTQSWSGRDIEAYRDILERADGAEYVSDEFSPGCMLRRNDRMVERSAYLICYRTKLTGGTAYTVRRACESRLRIRNLAGPPTASKN